MTTKKKIITIIIGVEAVIIAAVIGFLFYINSDTVKVNRQLELAQRYLLEEDYEQAIAAFGVVIDIDPRNEDAYLGLAEAYAAVNDLENAVKILEKASRKIDSEEVLAQLEIHTAEIEQREQAAQRAAEAAQAAATSPEGTVTAPQQESAATETPQPESETVLRGFIVRGDDWYFYDETGKLVTGWFDTNGSRYCARTDGTLYRDGEHEIDSTKYQFDQLGVCLGEVEDEQERLFAEEDARLLQILKTDSDLEELMTILALYYVEDGNTIDWSETSEDVERNLNSLLGGNKESIKYFFDFEAPPALWLTWVQENQPENHDELGYNSAHLTGKQVEYLVSSICGKQISIDFSSYDTGEYITWRDPYLGFGGEAGYYPWNELHDFSVERVNADTWKVRANDMYSDGNSDLQLVARLCFTVIRNVDSCFDGYSLTNVEVELVDSVNAGKRAYAESTDNSPAGIERNGIVSNGVNYFVNNDDFEASLTQKQYDLWVEFVGTDLNSQFGGQLHFDKFDGVVLKASSSTANITITYSNGKWTGIAIGH